MDLGLQALRMPVLPVPALPQAVHGHARDSPCGMSRRACRSAGCGGSRAAGRGPGSGATMMLIWGQMQPTWKCVETGEHEWREVPTVTGSKMLNDNAV